MKRIRKSVWLPTLLAIYFIAMMAIFGPELLRNGEKARFFTVATVEIIVIILVYLFYRHREKKGF